MPVEVRFQDLHSFCALEQLLKGLQADHMATECCKCTLAQSGPLYGSDHRFCRSLSPSISFAHSAGEIALGCKIQDTIHLLKNKVIQCDTHWQTAI